MNKKTVKEVSFQGKKALVRVDFNVPLDGGKVTDDTRIRAALPTLNHILEDGGSLVLMSHLGRPKGGPDPELSLKPAADRLSELLGKPVNFVGDCVGDEVKAAFEGVVRIAHYDGDYGRVVVIRHNNGLETLYGHLSQFKVKEGEKVEAGDVIGLGGNTGRSTGSHLHFEVRYLGEPINPNEVIDWELGYLCSDTLHLNAEHFEYLVEVRKRKYHTIRRGDTLSGIARRYGTSVGNLCRLNGIRSSTTLRIGRKIRYN